MTGENVETGVETTERRHNGPYEEPRGAEHPEAREAAHGLGHQFAELSQEAVLLVQGEVALARAELNEKVSTLERGITASAAGGAILLSGLIVLLMAAVFALALLVPLWLSALIIGGVAALIGGISLGAGRRNLSGRGLKPRRMIDEAKATRTFMKEQMP